MAGNKVLLILRDPLELYVRMADCKRGKFLSFVSNIKFYDQAVGAERMVVHYEDLVADPATMCATMAFFELSPADGLPVPTEALVRDRWEALGTASRQNYDQKQGGSGGAQTKDNPTDFAHHQRSLSEAEKREVWAFLSLRLTASEMALLKRYQPAKLPRPTLGDRLRNLVV